VNDVDAPGYNRWTQSIPALGDIRSGRCHDDNGTNDEDEELTEGMAESTLEEAALSWFADLDYGVAHGEEIAPEGRLAERDSFAHVLLIQRLRDAIDRLNPTIPEEAREDALLGLDNH